MKQAKTIHLKRHQTEEIDFNSNADQNAMANLLVKIVIAARRLQENARVYGGWKVGFGARRSEP